MTTQVLRLALSAVAASAAWWTGLVVVFGPAQRVLANPGLQSSKFLDALSGPPPPRIEESSWGFALGLLAVGVAFAGAYAWQSPRIPGGTAAKGVRFGVLAWALMVPWFEFYLPWNVLREPLALVLLECLCWAVLLPWVGLATAYANAVGVPRHVAVQTTMPDSHKPQEAQT